MLLLEQGQLLIQVLLLGQMLQLETNDLLPQSVLFVTSLLTHRIDIKAAI